MPSRDAVLALVSRLAQKTQSLDSLGGQPAYPWEDIAWAFAGVADGPMALVRAAYSRETGAEMKAAEALGAEMRALPEVQKWGMTDRQRRGVCLRVVHDIVEPLLCRRCEGRGVIYPRGASARTCDKCDGRRLRTLAPRELARYIDVAADNCRRHGIWMQRYRVVGMRADTWLYEALDVAQRNLRRDEDG